MLSFSEVRKIKDYDLQDGSNEETDKRPFNSPDPTLEAGDRRIDDTMKVRMAACSVVAGPIVITLVRMLMCFVAMFVCLFQVNQTSSNDFLSSVTNLSRISKRLRIAGLLRQSRAL